MEEISKKSQNGHDHDQLHFFFFPFMAQGHLRPAIAMANLFASLGQRSTVVTTKSLQTNIQGVEFLTIEIPCAEVGLPEGTDSVHAASNEDRPKFTAALALLAPQLDRLLRAHRPDCLVADMFFPWANAVAEARGVPRIVFHGSSCFALSCSLSVHIHRPQDGVSSGSESFLIPGLPVEVTLTSGKLPEFMRRGGGVDESDRAFAKLFDEAKRSDLESYGVVINSFHGLESGLAECYTNVFGVKRVWLIGPISPLEQEHDGGDEHGCLRWLDSKKPGSVVYVCFGTLANLSDAQLVEIAAGLVASGKEFLWVVGRDFDSPSESALEERGKVVRGWAPQGKILHHVAVGGFVTHCGWNSTLEAVCGGVPMVTWPLGAEQFYNELLVSRVLGVGVEIGVGTWSKTGGDFVGRDRVEMAIRRLMEGDEADAMRGRAERLAGMARQAVVEGGSSRLDLESLFQELRSIRARK